MGAPHADDGIRRKQADVENPISSMQRPEDVSLRPCLSPVPEDEPRTDRRAAYTPHRTWRTTPRCLLSDWSPGRKRWEHQRRCLL